MPRFSTPYYVSGKSAQRWHTNKAENAGTWAVGAGLTAAALHHPHSRGFALDVARSKGYHVQSAHAKSFGTAVGFAAGGVGAYAGYHAYRAHKIKQGMRRTHGR